MNLNTNQIVSISEANQNFFRVARMTDKHGEQRKAKKYGFEILFETAHFWHPDWNTKRKKDAMRFVRGRAPTNIKNL